MKRIIFTAAILAVLFTSCEGPMGPAGPGTSWQVINLAVGADDWTYSNVANNNYYYAVFDNIPELSSFVYDEGLVQCYIEFNAGTSTASQQLLPYVRHHEVYVESESQWATYTQTIDYEYGQGGLTLYVTNSDFVYDAISTPGAMNFRLVLMW